MQLYKLRLLFFVLIPLSGVAILCSDAQKAPQPVNKNKQVKTGAEILIERHLGELKGKKVGLVMNPTARIGNTHMLDTLLALSVNVTALFAPEHGFRGNFGAGEEIEDGIDRATGLPVYSLYGQTKIPSARMLENVDLLLFDMQDVGARFYTYNVTLGNILVAAGEYGTAVWVLDRPNPAGNYVGGWILEESYRSFVGTYPIPITHGMTLGELGKMMIGEEWLDTGKKPEYRVIEMEGWKRNMLWPETGLPWIPPSPNLPTFKHALVYLGTAFFEGTTMSEGRGTSDPFLTVGDPHFTYEPSAMKRLERIYHVNIDSVSFTPVSIPGKALHPKHENKKCKGIRISVPDLQKFTKPASFGIDLMRTMLRLTPGAEVKPFLYTLAGTKKHMVELLERETLLPHNTWKESREKFINKRAGYLIY